ncbi:uncharacterized protein LOC111372749 isoform X2 [Olea europaea subsp. europaea]|uniref:Uncharacterized protein LOC111372749 isoform X2 n=1 Tax=Olea europaea subsp. europaea TaxID=158383 RepID=A0A8S0TJE7_OLEEU|nr:uncharacterized protein LOC111372749 isoform X2 [Olea europaea subsp. europaea]
MKGPHVKHILEMFDVYRAEKPFSQFTSKLDILEAIAKLGPKENSFAAIRTYENDLAQFTLVGSVDFKQVLTVATTDGGEAFDEHISAGMLAMVVETVFSGHGDEHSSVPT